MFQVRGESVGSAAACFSCLSLQKHNVSSFLVCRVTEVDGAVDVMMKCVVHCVSRLAGLRGPQKLHEHLPTECLLMTCTALWYEQHMLMHL